MANTQKFQAIIEVNSSKAHAEVEKLRKEQKAAMDEIIRLKAKDSGATKEQIKAAEQKLKVVTDTLKKEEIQFRVMVKDWEKNIGSGNATLDWD